MTSVQVIDSDREGGSGGTLRRFPLSLQVFCRPPTVTPWRLWVWISCCCCSLMFGSNVSHLSHEPKLIPQLYFMQLQFHHCQLL